MPLYYLLRRPTARPLAAILLLSALTASGAWAADQPVLKDNAREYLALRQSLKAATLTPQQMIGPRAEWRGRPVELFGRINAHTATASGGVVTRVTFTLQLPGLSQLVVVDATEEQPLIDVDKVVHVLAELATDARPTDHFLLRAIIQEGDLPAEEQRYAAAEAAAATPAKDPINKIDNSIPIDASKPPLKADEPEPPAAPEQPLVRPGTEMPQLTPAASKGIGPWKQWVAKQNGRLTDQQIEIIVHSVIYYSALYGVDHRLVFSVIKCESGYNPSSVSHAGAIGLCQLMPGTARGLGVDPWDLERNIAGGTKYLADQLQAYAGRSNWEQCALALSAYNAGPGAVKRAGGIPDIPETVRYVEKVTKLFLELHKAGLP